MATQSLQLKSSGKFNLFPIIKLALGLIILIIIFVALIWFALKLFNSESKNQNDLISQQLNEITPQFSGANQGVFIADSFAQPQKISAQNIKGGVNGILATDTFSLPLNPEIKAGQKGIQISSLFMQDEITADTPLVEAAVILLDQANNALNLSVKKEISGSYDRGIALENHIKLLQNLQQNAKNQFANIQAKKAQAESEWQAATDRASTKEESFLNNIEGLNASITEQSLGEFINEKKLAVEKRAEFGALSNLEKKYENILLQLGQKIDLIEKNREALILGIAE